MNSHREKQVRRSPSLPSHQGLTPRARAQSLADYLTGAAYAGYIEEAITHAKLMLNGVIAEENDERLWYAGFRIQWRRGKPGFPAYYKVHDLEPTGAGYRRQSGETSRDYRRRMALV